MNTRPNPPTQKTVKQSKGHKNWNRMIPDNEGDGNKTQSWLQQGKIRDPNLASHWNISSIKSREKCIAKKYSQTITRKKRTVQSPG